MRIPLLLRPISARCSRGFGTCFATRESAEIAATTFTHPRALRFGLSGNASRFRPCRRIKHAATLWAARLGETVDRVTTARTAGFRILATRAVREKPRGRCRGAGADHEVDPAQTSLPWLGNCGEFNWAAPKIDQRDQPWIYVIGRRVLSPPRATDIAIYGLAISLVPLISFASAAPTRWGVPFFLFGVQ